MSKVQPLAPQNERRPIDPVSRIYGPPEEGARSKKVVTGEDWHTLADYFFVNEQKLMYYNFKTTTPAEVNWYLREYVGCTTPDQRRDNWKFTSDAKPGIIWAPPRKIISKDVPHLLDSPWSESWGAHLNLPPGGPHMAERTFDATHLALLALEIAGVHGLGVTFGATLGLVLIPTMVLAAMGGAEMDGFRIQSKRVARDGYALGAVLGAKGTSATHMQRWYMANYWPDKKLQNVYNAAMAGGYLDGKKLNETQIRRLFEILHSRMTGRIPKGNDWYEWSDATRKDYNDRAALAFKMTFLRP